MSLDDTIENILKTINTEVKMLLQLLLRPSIEEIEGLSGSQLARKLRLYASEEWMMDDSTIIKTCKKLADLEALSRLINEKRTQERPAKYYFVTNNGEENIYRPLAALGLRTVVESGVSFYSIFSCFGGTKVEDGRSNLASKGLVYVFNILLGFYYLNGISKPNYSEEGLQSKTLSYGSISDVTGINDPTVRRIITRLQDTGLIEVCEKELEYSYSRIKSLKGIKGQKQWIKLVRDIDSFVEERGDSGFTMNELYEALQEKGKKYKKKRIIDTLTRLTARGYFSRENGKESYDIKLTELGEKIVKSFFIPMYRLLKRLETKEEIYSRAGFKEPIEIGSDTIKKALAIYSKAEKHIIAS